eukprot:15470189-Alexandrium_andersonii.AAC.1
MALSTARTATGCAKLGWSSTSQSSSGAVGVPWVILARRSLPTLGARPHSRRGAAGTGTARLTERSG